jgi:hypothetical protein
MYLWIVAGLLTTYFCFLSEFVYFLLPKVRMDLRVDPRYEKNVHRFVIVRQILLFLLPLALSASTLGVDVTSKELTSLIVLGLSINVFWVVQLPLLTKAHLFIDFAVDQIEVFRPTIDIDANSEHLIYTRIYNTGFSTLKNAMVLIYFGKGFQIVASGDPRYDNIDFRKDFSVQKNNCGVGFLPTKNFQTLPPQEWFLFPVIVITPKKQEVPRIEIQLSSENSWGMTKYAASISVKQVALK